MPVQSMHKEAGGPACHGQLVSEIKRTLCLLVTKYQSALLPRSFEIGTLERLQVWQLAFIFRRNSIPCPVHVIPDGSLWPILILIDNEMRSSIGTTAVSDYLSSLPLSCK